MFDIEVIAFNALYTLYLNNNIKKISIDDLYKYEKLVLFLIKQNKLDYEFKNSENFILDLKHYKDYITLEEIDDQLYYSINNFELIQKVVETLPTELLNILKEAMLIIIVDILKKRNINKKIKNF